MSRMKSLDSLMLRSDDGLLQSNVARERERTF